MIRGEPLMFLQASCQIQLMVARGCAVKAAKAKKKSGEGDTGHCNEHLQDVSH